jgi:glutamine synthetase
VTVDAQELRILFPDLLGIARSKITTPAELEKEHRFAAATYLIGHDVEPLILPGLSADRGFPDVAVRAETETLRAGWNADEAIVLASSFAADGSPFPLDVREALRRAVAAWADRGLTPRIGFEMEMFVLEPDGAGGWRPLDAPGARPYGSGPDVDPTGVSRAVMTAARKVGLPVEGLISEFFAGQFEVTLRFVDALEACDDAFLFRLLAREVAHEHGLKVTFMPRPFADRGGNGLHVNVSLVDEAGHNVLQDSAAPDGLAGELVRPFVAGLLEHHEGMCALLAPSVNSYKRLTPGLLAGYFADWGHDDRFVTVRIPAARGEATRIESRLPDGVANPYLVAAAVLHAGLAGVERGLEPPPPQDRSPDAPPAERRAPSSLGAAIEALERDAELRRRLGETLTEAFLILKRHEWERFERAVTDWELAEYLPHH